MEPLDEQYEALKQAWTDKLVQVNADRPELARFKDLVGRVITVNCGGKAIVDFDDGGWYDITASEEFLRKVEGEEFQSKYKGTVNSAQPFPSKQ